MSHQLLVRAAMNYARSKGRPLDPDLLELALDVRASFREGSATRWPSGSVFELMLLAWPQRHDLEEPKAADLVETLDTWWRYLRASGRLESGSAEPKDLVHEARRAAPRMHDTFVNAVEYAEAASDEDEPSMSLRELLDWSGPRNRKPVQLPSPVSPTQLLTVHVSLDGTDPLVWRRLVVSGATRLDRLHGILQTVMGWSNIHLHEFAAIRDGQREIPFHAGAGRDRSGIDERDVQLDQVLRDVGDELAYEYDLGDAWHHTVRLEALTEPPTESAETPSGPVAVARCLDGAGACPPEDVGGIPAYLEGVAWARGERPRGTPPPEGLEWAEGYDPDVFSVAAVNAALGELARSPGPAAYRR